MRPFLAPADGAPRPGPASAQWQISTAAESMAAVAARRQGAVLHCTRWRDDGRANHGPAATTSAPARRWRCFQTRIVGGGTNIDLGRQSMSLRDGRF